MVSFTFDPQRYPAQPGCYLMVDAAGRILYVGKAKNLRRRLGSYFRVPGGNRAPGRDWKARRLAALESIRLGSFTSMIAFRPCWYSTKKSGR